MPELNRSQDLVLTHGIDALRNHSPLVFPPRNSPDPGRRVEAALRTAGRAQSLVDQDATSNRTILTSGRAGSCSGRSYHIGLGVVKGNGLVGGALRPQLADHLGDRVRVGVTVAQPCSCPSNV